MAKKHSDYNLWGRIQHTATFKKIKNSTDKLKENYEQRTSNFPSDQQNFELKHLNHQYSHEKNLLSRSDYQKNLRRKKQHDKSQSNSSINQASSLWLRFDRVYGLIKRVAILSILAFILIAVLTFGVGYGYFVSLLNQENTLDQKELVQEVSSVSSTSSLYYSNGQKISDLRNDLSRTPISIDEMPLDVLAAVIATEDNYFYEHDGIVPKAIVRAVMEQIFKGDGSGGSTLTQQLVKQQLLSNETSFERKANEIDLAMELEDLIDKEDILESYMNVSPFGRNNQGQNIAGIEEAAEGIFGIEAAELSLPQSAFLAGLPKSPIEYSPYDQNGYLKEDYSAGINRQKDVLFFMLREGYISKEEYQQAESYDIAQDFIPHEERDDIERSYLYDEVERRARDILIDHLIAEEGREPDEVNNDPALADDYYQRADFLLRNGGYKIKTSIDPDLHAALNQSIIDNAWYIGSPREVYWTDDESGEDQYMVDYAQNGSILLDNESGRILAFVGGVNYEDNHVNHATQSRRSPASALKPLAVYGPALELGIITPASMVYDRPITFSAEQTGGTSYSPANAEGFSHRWWNAREALARSQNIPAIRIYNQLYREHDLKPYFRNAGLGPEAITDEDFATLSLALGGVSKGTTVEEMAGVFAAIANDGQYVQPYMIESIEDPHGEMIFQADNEQEVNQVFNKNTAYLLQDMLRDVSTEGTGQTSRAELAFDLDLMSKTGTTDSQRDIWYIGSTPKMTLSSWMGYSNTITHNNLSREFGGGPTSRSQRIWARMMNAIYYTNADVIGLDEEFDKPAGIVSESVLDSTGMQPAEVRLANGQKIEVNGSMKEELFLADAVPGPTVYDFAIDATEEELSSFWSAYIESLRSAEEEEEEIEEQESHQQDQTDEEENESILDGLIDGLKDQFTS